MVLPPAKVEVVLATEKDGSCIPELASLCAGSKIGFAMFATELAVQRNRFFSKEIAAEVAEALQGEISMASVAKLKKDLINKLGCEGEDTPNKREVAIECMGMPLKLVVETIGEDRMSDDYDFISRGGTSRGVI